MTLDDPQMYIRPVTIKFTQDLWADSDVFEFVCNENKRISSTPDTIELSDHVEEAVWKL